MSHEATDPGSAVEFVAKPTEGDRSTIAVLGEVDIASSERFLAHGRAGLDGGAKVLEIDLAGVTFMDSSGLSALVMIRAAARERGVQLLVTNVPAPIERLFTVTGLQELLHAPPGD